MQLRGLPHYAAGIIVKGFGRGSKDLGIPTANFAPDVVQQLPEDIATGIYFGWANVDHGTVHPMVMSIGWNPYFHNKQKSMETHIMHPFDGDLYGKLLKVCICGYIRPEQDFTTLEALIEVINADIELAKRTLGDGSPFDALRKVAFFTDTTANGWTHSNNEDGPTKQQQNADNDAHTKS